jgi:hypothetical protein
MKKIIYLLLFIVFSDGLFSQVTVSAERANIDSIYTFSKVGGARELLVLNKRFYGTADSSGKTDNSVYARKTHSNIWDSSQTFSGGLTLGSPIAGNKSIIMWNSGIERYDSLYFDVDSYYLSYDGDLKIKGNIEAVGNVYGEYITGSGALLTGIVADSTKQKIFRVGNNRYDDAFTFTNDLAKMNTVPHALMNIHRGGLSSYETNDDLFGLIVYNRPTNTDSTKANNGGAWIGTSDSLNNYSSRLWQPLRVQHDHYSPRVNMPVNVITSKFSFYNGAGKAQNILLYDAVIENNKSADAEADTAVAYRVRKSFTDTLTSPYRFAFQNLSTAPMVTAGRITSDSGMYALSFNGSGSDLTGVLKPADSTTLKNSVLSQVLKNADSTTQRNYSNSLYLKNTDSTTLKNSVLSQVLKNADSTTLKNSVLSQVLKNADSTTVKNSMKATANTWLATQTYSSTGYGSLISLVRDGAEVGKLDNASPGMRFMAGTSKDLALYVSGDKGIVVRQTTGNVGLGTGTPFSTLTSYVPFTTLSGLNVTYAPKNTTVSSLAQSIDTSSFNVAFTGTGKPVVTLTGATANSIMKIDSAGNVGINVLAPTEKLDVSGNIKADTIKAKISVSNIVDIATAIWDIRTYSDTLQAGDSLVVTLPSVSGYTFHHASFDSWVADSAGFGPVAIRKGASTNTFISYHTGDVGKRFYYTLYYKPD